MFDCPGQEFIDVNWSAGFYREFPNSGNLQNALRLTVQAPSVECPLTAQTKSVSKVILSSDVMFSVPPTKWLLDEQ